MNAKIDRRHIVKGLGAASLAALLGLREERIAQAQTTADPSDLVLNVMKDYGAKGDGSTDDTPAIQAALQAATGPQVVYFPGKRANGGFTQYRYTQPITLRAGNRIRGDWNATELVYAGGSGGNGIQIDHSASAEPSRFEIENIRLKGPAGASSTGTGIFMDRYANDLRLRNVFVSGFRDCFYIGSTVAGSIADFSLIESCWASDPGRYGFNLERLNNNHLMEHCQCDIGAGTSGQASVRIAQQGAGATLHILGMKAENENGAHMFVFDDDTPPMTLIESPIYSKGPGTGDLIRINYEIRDALQALNLIAGVGAAKNLIHHIPQGYQISAVAGSNGVARRLAHWSSGERLMSADNGNKDVTLPAFPCEIQMFNTPLNANRTITISNQTARIIRVVRGPGATGGSFNLRISDGTNVLKSLGNANTWAEFYADGTKVSQIGGGSL